MDEGGGSGLVTVVRGRVLDRNSARRQVRYERKSPLPFKKKRFYGKSAEERRPSVQRIEQTRPQKFRGIRQPIAIWDFLPKHSNCTVVISDSSTVLVARSDQWWPSPPVAVQCTDDTCLHD